MAWSLRKCLGDLAVRGSAGKSRSRKNKRQLLLGQPRRAALSLELLEDRVVPSTITWTDRGQDADGFARVFGPKANEARQVVDSAISSWTSVVTNFNQPGGGDNINVHITASGYGNGAVTSGITYRGGWPISANIALGGGQDGHGSGYFIDLTPKDSSEFEGNMVNPFSGYAQQGSPAAGLIDLYTIALHELGHALGFVAGSRLQTTGYAHNTGVLATPGQPALGYLWAFEGPTVSHLTTSDNAGTSDAGGPEHTAYTNQTATWAGQTLQGAEDLMNAGTGPSERRFIPSYLAQMLHDAYNYTIIPAASFPTFHAVFNQTTGNLLVRGRLDAASADGVTLDTSSGSVTTSVTIGTPVTGTNYPGPYTQSFPGALVKSITVRLTAAGASPSRM